MRKARACGGGRVRSQARSIATISAVMICASIGSACLDRELAPLSPCLFSTVSEKVSGEGVTAVDVLFMIDNSGSMADEQAALIRELPLLVRVLSSGDRDQDGVQDFRPVELRLGVVSSDMGLPGIGVANVTCPNDRGDDGVLQHTRNPSNPACTRDFYPPFLSFTPPPPEQAEAAVNAIANDFACISALGTQGCGYEQQLEATLKALWPSDHMVQGIDARGALGGMPSFVIDPNTQQGGSGQGDPFGANAGFLHNDAREGLSLIAVVLVTDEEDCSSFNLAHFDAGPALGPSGLRCFNNKQNLYPVQRYIDGLKALRPGREDLVIFAAITGVAPELVDEAALGRVNFDDRAQSNSFFDGILAHSSMIETPVDTMGNDGVPDKLMWSCANGVGADMQEAYPPRRIVEVAKGFGKNGLVQSICQSSFAPAMARIIDRIIDNLPSVCLPRKLTRNVTGHVDCRVVWDLPKASIVAPTRCDDPRYIGLLSSPPSGRKTLTDDGRVICDLAQVAVGPCAPNGQPNDPCASGIGPTPAGRGWYYDDFSEDIEQCAGVDKQRIAFSEDAAPPNGVVVRLECTTQVQNIVALRDDLLNPSTSPNIGEPCTNDMQCAVALNTAAGCLSAQPFRLDVAGVCHDTSMFCHDAKQRCVKACDNDSQCPEAWSCDMDGAINPLSETRNHPICVNPTCGN